MKKILFTLLGGFLILIGLVFIIIPGPAIIFIIPGLVLISLVNHKATPWLRKSMKLMRRSSVWIDSAIQRRKMYK